MKEIENLKNVPTGRSTKVFKIKEKIMGKKKQSQIQEAIEDLDNGKLIVDKEKIKENQ